MLLLLFIIIIITITTNVVVIINILKTSLVVGELKSNLNVSIRTHVLTFRKIFSVTKKPQHVKVKVTYRSEEQFLYLVYLIEIKYSCDDKMKCIPK